MPGTLTVRVLGARSLPIMDKGAETTDAFVEARLGSVVHKTAVCGKSLSPRWEEEVFRWEAEDAELQDEWLQLRVMDYDTYSANDAIGRVALSLAPFVRMAAAAQAPVVRQGWLPITDSLHGLRGDLELSVELDLFADANKARQSSAGLPLFVSAQPPQGQLLLEVLGDVRDLTTADDPEFAWLDKIRSPRATNDARQALLRSQATQVARRVGFKALALHANAVIGYSVAVDIEGESSGLLVTRAQGTAVLLRPVIHPSLQHQRSLSLCEDEKENALPLPPSAPRIPSPLVESEAEAAFEAMEQRRASEDASECSEPWRKMSRKVSRWSGPSFSRQLTVSEQSEEPNDMDDALSAALNFAGCLSEGRRPHLPFLSVEGLPDGWVTGLGGVVASRSVKVLEDVEDKDSWDAVSSRGAWWAELREEIRAHLRALACNAVLGYREELVLRKDVALLSASGTAVRLFEDEEEACHFAHLAYTLPALPFSPTIRPCALCGSAAVPDLALLTCQPPSSLLDPDVPALLLHIPVLRKVAENGGEDLAKEISQLFPFVEHQMHSQLMAKLEAGRYNVAYGIRSTVAVGENLLTCVMTATLGRLTPLESREGPASPPREASGSPNQLDLTSGGATACLALPGDSGPQPKDWTLEAELAEEIPSAVLQPWEGRLAAETLWEGREDSEGGGRAGLEQRIKGALGKLRRRGDRAKSRGGLRGELETLLRQTALSVGVVGQRGLSCGGTEVELLMTGLGAEAGRSGEWGSVWVEAGWETERGRVGEYVGRAEAVVVREAGDVREEGGAEAFVRLSLEEALTGLRAQAALLGGDGLLSLRFALSDLSLSKNHAQTILHLYADVVTLAT